MTPESEAVFKEWMAERRAEMSDALQKVRGHYRLRKITDAADNRMRTRTARQQHADGRVVVNWQPRQRLIHCRRLCGVDRYEL